MNDIGINLYSIRTLIKTDEMFCATAIKLKKMGYTNFHYAGIRFNAELIAKIHRESGIKTVVADARMDRILDDTDNLIDEYKSVGCYNIGLGMMPADISTDEDKCLETINKLNAAAKKMFDKGCKFFYHHHHYEFYKLAGGKCCFDYLIENAPYINFILDTYWLQYAGLNILDVLNGVKGRAECIHLKDYKIHKTKENQFIPYFAAIGEGTLDFNAIIKKAYETGVKHFFVEQDDAVDFDDPLSEVEKSINYLKLIKTT